MTAVSLSVRDLERDTAEGVDGGVALAVAPRNLVRRDGRKTVAVIDQDALVSQRGCSCIHGDSLGVCGFSSLPYAKGDSSLWTSSACGHIF